jgi:uncharacterized membrane protein YphA (DoxX/SURF4 family)
MFSYGFSKVLNTQFKSPGLEALVTPLGEMSPRALLWAFMGRSAGYTVFTGIAECIGGALLLFRRTTTLGALVVVAVMANVVMLNLSYDVPVKLYAIHLLLLAIFLAAPDLGSLTRLLVFRRTAEPSALAPHFSSVQGRRAGGAIKVAVVGYIVLAKLYLQMQDWRASIDRAPRPSLYGVWEVERFSRDGVDVPPLTTDATRWRRIVIERSTKGSGRSEVTRWMMDNTRDSLHGTGDDSAHTLTLQEGGGHAPPVTLVYARPDPDHLVLTGVPDDRKPIRVELRRASEKETRLVTQTFRWSIGDRVFGGDAK